MKEFKNPEIEITEFEIEDVITTSDTLNEDNLGEWN